MHHCQTCIHIVKTHNKLTLSIRNNASLSVVWIIDLKFLFKKSNKMTMA